MSFYVCPGANQKALALLGSQTGRPQNVRIPISARAKIVGQKGLNFRPRAIMLYDDHQFVLGRNKFTVYLLPPPDKILLAVSTISHLASIFSGKHIGIRIRKSNDRENYSNNVIVKVMNEMGNEILFLDFEIGDDELYLNNLTSKQKGTGGAALAALYCIAKDLGLNQIRYYVHLLNDNARRFYLHMDFGEPLNEDFCKWRVRL